MGPTVSVTETKEVPSGKGVMKFGSLVVDTNRRQVSRAGERISLTYTDLIYNSGAAYACPILLYKIELGSSIHEEHIEIFHRGSHDGLRELWTTRGSEITIDILSDFDPYLGRIAGGDPRNKGQGA